MSLLKDIYNSLPKNKNKNSSIFVRYFVRPISIFLSPLFLKLSPNLISLIALFLAILSLYFLLKSILIGGIILLLWLIFDCIDGNIARYKNQYTLYGDYIDSLSSLLLVISLPLVIMLNLIQNTPFFLGINILNFGVFVAILINFSRLAYQKFRNASLENKNEKTLTYSKLMLDDKQIKNKILIIGNRIEKNFGISGFFIPLLIISELFNFEIYFYLIYYTFFASYSIISILYLIIKALKESEGT